MTALNSEGLEKARDALAKLYRGEGDEPFHLMATTAITAYLSALPPVDGLEVVAWVDAGTIDLSWEKKIVATNPEFVQRNGGLGQFQPLVPLSQASSVIAGLKDEIADLRDEWQAEYDTRLAANTARRAVEARISSLKEENKRLREIVKAVAHIGVDFGFGPYELEHHFIEDARKALEDRNG